MATLPIVHFQTPAEKYRLIQQAIINRCPISALYDGRARMLCPHVLGSDKLGHPQALSYQFGGGSNSRPLGPDGSPENWRCLALEKLTNVQNIDGKWHTAPNHSRPQTCVKVIDVEVV